MAPRPSPLSPHGVPGYGTTQGFEYGEGPYRFIQQDWWRHTRYAVFEQVFEADPEGERIRNSKVPTRRDVQRAEALRGVASECLLVSLKEVPGGASHALAAFTAWAPSCPIAPQRLDWSTAAAASS